MNISSDILNMKYIIFNAFLSVYREVELSADKSENATARLKSFFLSQTDNSILTILRKITLIRLSWLK